ISHATIEQSCSIHYFVDVSERIVNRSNREIYSDVCCIS
ncbi:unnamed protein product, partial [Larinioides sclopetarius]